MRKRTLSRFFIVLMTSMVVISVVLIAIKEELFVKNHFNYNTDNVEITHRNETDTGDEAENKTIFQMGEDISFNGLIYKVNSAEVTKKHGDFIAPTNFNESYTFDEDGNLIDNNSYAVINLTLRNEGEVVKELYLNTYRLAISNEDYSKCFDFAECISLSKTEGYNSKDYFKVVIEPHSEGTWNLVYIGGDHGLQCNNCHLFIYRNQAVSKSEARDEFRNIEIKFTN